MRSSALRPLLKQTGLLIIALAGIVLIPLALHNQTGPLPSSVAAASSPVHKTVWLRGNAALNWNRTNPGPFISVVSGDLVTVMLVSDDGLTHSWHLDLNNNNAVDPNEPFSGLFSSTATFLNFTFTPTIGVNIPAAGNFTYKCSVHPFSMLGTFRVMPPQISTTPVFASTLDGLRVSTNGTLTIDTRALTLSGQITVKSNNSTTGLVVFSKTYSIPNIRLQTMQNSPALVTRFIMNASGPTGHSVDVTVQLSGLTMTSTSLLTRQLDINANGVVDLGDVSVVAADFGSTIGGAKYNPVADFNADGRINLSDISIIALYYQRPDLR